MGLLSTYLDVISEPLEWNCAHSPVIYEATPKYISVLGIGAIDGKMNFSYATAPPIPIAAGQLVYFDASQYKGFHVITSVDVAMNIIYTDTDYAGIATTALNWAHCPTLVFNIYSGYRTGEGNLALRTNLPSTLIASFFVEINTVTITYKWDISGYLKSIFTIPSPADGINYSLFNRFRLEFVTMSDTLEHYQVGNCAMTSEQITAKVNNGYLTEDDPFFSQCGTTVISRLTGSWILTYKIECGLENQQDFNVSDFKAGSQSGVDDYVSRTQNIGNYGG